MRPTQIQIQFGYSFSLLSLSSRVLEVDEPQIHLSFSQAATLLLGPSHLVFRARNGRKQEILCLGS